MEEAARQKGHPAMSARLIRWSGPLLILAGVVQVPAMVFDPDQFDPHSFVNPLEGPDHILWSLNGLLIVLGLPGLWLAESERAGRAGLIGFLFVLAGATLSTGLSMMWAFMLPSATAVFGNGASLQTAFQPGQPMWPIAVPVVPIRLTWLPGNVIFGIASARARVLPAWCGWLLAAGVLVSLGAGAGPAGRWIAIAGILLMSAAWCGFGYSLSRARGEPNLARSGQGSKTT